MTLTGPDIRVLQVHPSRRCNLRCAHCYSCSGPDESGELPAALLRPAVRDAAGLGYNVLSVSGGEPTLYSGLRSICRQAHSSGMISTLVTNGTALSARGIAALRDLVDVIAISIEGKPERHNRVRRSPLAFQEMEKRLELLKTARIPFAFVFTLRRDNLPDLRWASEFAAAKGALLLQVRPIEAHGCAYPELSGERPTDQQMATAWMTVEYLREIHRGILAIHFDAVNRYELERPADSLRFDRDPRCGLLAEMVSPLVIEEDGAVVPTRYGFARRYALGNLHQTTLAAMAGGWMTTGAADYGALCRGAVAKVRSSVSMFVNWRERLSVEAGRVAPVVLAAVG